LKRLKYLRELQVRQMGSIDKTIRALAGSKSLRKLKAVNTGLTDEHLKLIATIPALDYLSISFNRALTDDGIKSLKPLKNLVHLNIAGSFTSKCFPYLKDFSHLKELVITQRLATKANRAVLAKFLPKNCSVRIDKASVAESLDGLDELSKINP
jgi:hypothetical protein